jgi:adenylate cyclase
MKRTNKRVLLYSVIAALLICLLAGVGALRRIDKWTQDLLFQHPSITTSDILLIGIDENAISELGPYNNWDRNIMASALDALASDPDKLPAVVAIDTLYVGESTPEADNHLAGAAEKLGNVITAVLAQFGEKRTWEDGYVSIDSYAVLGVEYPYEALKNVTEQGHINAMYDRDGILRHAILYYEDEDGNRAYSMAFMCAKKLLESRGEEVKYPFVNKIGQYYVPYTSKPGGYYDGFSIADLINGRIPSDYYAGKIVLIGPYTSGLQDAYFTPIERANQMFGVEYQANVIQSLIEYNFKKEVSDWPQLAILFVICAAVGFVYQKKSVAVSGAVAAVTAGLGMWIPYLLFGAGFVTHTFWIPAGALILYIVSVGDQYVRAAVGRRNITRTFERYVAPEIVGEILKEDSSALSLGGKLCDIAVLFVDLRGFTTMSARLDPEKVVFILNRYLTMTSECIERNRGTLDKFIGDATMAFWGAPLPQENAVYLAAKTALEIANGAKVVSDKLKEEVGEEIKAGVGVHFGPAVVGNMGSEKHMDYTAIGDTVNTASRLESNAPGGTVYISRVVADMLGSQAKVTSLGGSIKLKGKEEGFEVLVLDELEGFDKDQYMNSLK